MGRLSLVAPARFHGRKRGRSLENLRQSVMQWWKMHCSHALSSVPALHYTASFYRPRCNASLPLLFLPLVMLHFRSCFRKNIERLVLMKSKLKTPLSPRESHLHALGHRLPRLWVRVCAVPPLLTGHRDGPESLTCCAVWFPKSNHEIVTTCDSHSVRFSSTLSESFPCDLGK